MWGDALLNLSPQPHPYILYPHARTRTLRVRFVFSARTHRHTHDNLHARAAHSYAGTHGAHRKWRGNHGGRVPRRTTALSHIADESWQDGFPRGSLRNCERRSDGATAPGASRAREWIRAG